MALSSQQFCDTCGAANRSQAAFCRVCGHRLAPSPNETLSLTLTGLLQFQSMLKQRYMILSQAGRGGFGAVYKAADTQFNNRLVAIKEMSQNNLTSQDYVEATESFKREALLLSGLTHPNLPRIYDQFTDTGRSYLVMDFIDGETLEQHLNTLGSKKIPLPKVLEIAIQLCSVLEYLHSRQPPIIFRDLKPANIMLTSTGHVYLIDFGIARHFKPGQAKDTTALGSLGYAAPEQYGKSQTTGRADIYSLGATLHQLLTGDDPSASPFQFAPLQLQEPGLSGLDTLIMSMVSVDITRRPASITDVKRALQQISTQYTAAQTHPLPQGIPSGYLPTTLPPIPPKVTKTPKGTRQHTPPQPRPQLNTLYICLGHSSRITGVSWSPNGNYLASTSYDKTVQIWDGKTGNNITTYHGHTQRVNALAWSPDSRCVATASDDGTVQVWEATTKRLLYTFQGHQGPVRAVAWSPLPDSQRIASAGDDHTVQVWGVNAGLPPFVYRGHSDRVDALAWSPDRKFIASAGKDHKIHIWDPTRDHQRRSFLSSLFSAPSGYKILNGHTGAVNGLAWSQDGYIASASSDHRVLIWNAFTGGILFSIGTKSSDMKNAVAWSTNRQAGSYLAIAGNDKTVQIWNRMARKLVFTYRGHTGYVMCAAWSPDGTRVASAGVDRTVQVWQAV